MWSAAHRLVLNVYRETDAFPSSERFGLAAQIRRSAVSIPSNLAEGRGRSTDRDFKRFVGIAIASCDELDYQLLLGSDLGYMQKEIASVLMGEANAVRRRLISLSRALAS